MGDIIGWLIFFALLLGPLTLPAFTAGYLAQKFPSCEWYKIVPVVSLPWPIIAYLILSAMKNDIDNEMGGHGPGPMLEFIAFYVGTVFAIIQSVVGFGAALGAFHFMRDRIGRKRDEPK